eukprot:m.36706 g.36706  ORF g.36706 m.36706 type:complete len:333 (-) comp12885_c0_seq2:1900-2898(-)
MRCLFIRHGLSRGNLRDIRAFIKLAKDGQPPEHHEVLVEEMLKGESHSEFEDDTALSEAGLEEAEHLGEHWADLLKEHAIAGRIRFFVSPMQRCMQTADPLLRKLRDCGADVRATVMPAIHEQPGLLHPDDKLWMKKEVLPLLSARTKVSERDALDRIRRRKFTPCGIPADELQRRFSWITDFEGFPSQESAPWYSGGRESKVGFDRRIGHVVGLIRKLQFELSDSDTLVFVSHGDFLGELFGRLLGNDSVSFSLMNTSISSLKFPQAGGGCILEFVNRTGHLTEQRNVQLYQSMEIKEKRSRSGKRYVDIGALMRTQKYFDSPMGLLAAKL